MSTCSEKNLISKHGEKIAVLESRIDSGAEKFRKIESKMTDMCDNMSNLSNALTQFTTAFSEQIKHKGELDKTVFEQASIDSERRHKETRDAVNKLTETVERLDKRMNENESAIEWAQGWQKFWKSSVTRLGAALIVGFGVWVGSLVVAEIKNDAQVEVVE